MRTSLNPTRLHSAPRAARPSRRTLTITNFREEETQKKGKQKKAAAPAPSVAAAPPAPPAAAKVSQLEALSRYSKVVADTGEINLIKQFKPIDATTNPSLVLKAMEVPEYQHLIPRALELNTREAHSLMGPKLDPTRPYDNVADILAVEIGAEILKLVPGRVSTEVDAHLSYDTQATIDKARRLIDLYGRKGVDPSRVYIKMAATWEGIKAAEELEKEGINTNLTLLFSMAQAQACADAGASLISPFVGRIMDYYKKKEGRDFTAEEDPGVISVRDIYAYYKTYKYKTIVMAASFRNVGEIRALAGVDNITISPKLLEELKASTDPLPRVLDPETSRTQAKRIVHNVGSFRRAHTADEMAVEKLIEGIAGFTKDQRTLEDLIAKAAVAKKH